MSNGKYSYLAKNTILFTVSSFGSKILVFLLVPLYTSILSTSEYGIADIITTSASLLMYVFTLNIAEAVLRFAIDKKDIQNRYLSYGLKVLLIGSLVFAICIAVVYSLRLFHWESYCYLFLFLDYFAVSLYQILSNYLRAIDKVKEVAISGLIHTLVTIISNLLFLLVLKKGLPGYLISIVVGSLISSVYCLIIIRLPANSLLHESVDKNTAHEMRAYSIPLIFNGIAWWMNNSLDKYFVIWMLGASENGILSVAYKIPTILTVFHSIFAQAWNLSAIKEFDSDDSDGFFSNTYSIYNSGLVLVCSVLILLNVPFARLLFAKDFFIAWRYSSILLISTLFACLSGILGSVFTAVKNSRIFAASTVSAAVVNCVFNAILIQLMGTSGAAIATVISFFVVWLIRLLYTRKYIKWHFSLKKDIIAYFLLIIQVSVEHLDGHMYPIQLVALVLIIIVYNAQYKKLVTGICSYIKNKMHK